LANFLAKLETKLKLSSSNTATLSEWNVVIYGTKENPDAKNRAAASGTSSASSTVKKPTPVAAAAAAATAAMATAANPAETDPHQNLVKPVDADFGTVATATAADRKSAAAAAQQNRVSSSLESAPPVAVGIGGGGALPAGALGSARRRLSKYLFGFVTGGRRLL